MPFAAVTLAAKTLPFINAFWLSKLYEDQS